MTVSMLLPILCILTKFTTTSCSKVPQGLRFPLDVRGLFATRCVQKVPTRDSDNLVKPFMHVAIQTTRHYAHNVILNSIKSRIQFFTSLQSSDCNFTIFEIESSVQSLRVLELINQLDGIGILLIIHIFHQTIE